MSIDQAWFPDLEADFEESVRIDREAPDEGDHRADAIDTYHVTADSGRFVSDFVDRLLGDAEDMRSGPNYWLYGYYGSGKSHLLTVLDGLLDTAWIDGQRDAIWEKLNSAGGSHSDTVDLDRVRQTWDRLHDEYHIIPISVNLLTYQGQKQRSFSDIVLRHAHQNPRLTGVDDSISSGLSAQLDVAYFENWVLLKRGVARLSDGYFRE
jgi:hypothetical protein